MFTVGVAASGALHCSASHFALRSPPAPASCSESVSLLGLGGGARPVLHRRGDGRKLHLEVKAGGDSRVARAHRRINAEVGGRRLRHDEVTARHRSDGAGSRDGYECLRSPLRQRLLRRFRFAFAAILHWLLLRSGCVAAAAATSATGGVSATLRRSRQLSLRHGVHDEEEKV
jgi:hypothetical protein